MEKFVNAWFGVDRKQDDKGKTFRESAHVIIRDFHRQPAIMAMCRIPLLLSLVCKLKYDGTLTSVSNRAELFHRVLLGLLRDWKKEKTTDGHGKTVDRTVVRDKIKLLEYVAWKMFREQPEQCYQEDLVDYIDEAIEELKRLPTLKNKPSLEILKEIQTDGIFTQTGTSPNSPYLWLHKTIHEYLAASFVARNRMLPGKVFGG